jgi:hypothetical protein
LNKWGISTPWLCFENLYASITKLVIAVSGFPPSTLPSMSSSTGRMKRVCGIEKDGDVGKRRREEGEEKIREDIANNLLLS